MITPLKNNLLIEVYKASSVFEMLDENQTEKGKVLAVGPLVDSVNKGDEIIFKSYALDKFEDGDDKYYILSEDDVKGIYA